MGVRGAKAGRWRVVVRESRGRKLLRNKDCIGAVEERERGEGGGVCDAQLALGNCCSRSR